MKTVANKKLTSRKKMLLLCLILIVTSLLSIDLNNYERYGGLPMH